MAGRSLALQDDLLHSLGRVVGVHDCAQRNHWTSGLLLWNEQLKFASSLLLLVLSLCGSCSVLVVSCALCSILQLLDSYLMVGEYGKLVRIY